MSDDKKLPVPRTQGPQMPALPTTGLPVSPPTFTTAFWANLQMKVSAHLYKRMNEIASQHLQLQTTLTEIERGRMTRESVLAEWDDLDNRLAHARAAANARHGLIAMHHIAQEGELGPELAAGMEGTEILRREPARFEQSHRQRIPHGKGGSG